MAYAKNLPGNLGNTDVLRAIYDKVDEIEVIPTPTDKIEYELDQLNEKIDTVNFNLAEFVEAKNIVQAIKDISIAVEPTDLTQVSKSLDKQTQAIKDISIAVEPTDLTQVSNAIKHQSKIIENQTQAIKDISINVDLHHISEVSDAIKHQTKIIENQTEAIKNLSFNTKIDVNIDTEKITNSIDHLSEKIDRGLEKNTKAINNIAKELKPEPPSPLPPPKPRPRPIPIEYDDYYLDTMINEAIWKYYRRVDPLYTEKVAIIERYNRCKN